MAIKILEFISFCPNIAFLGCYKNATKADDNFMCPLYPLDWQEPNSTYNPRWIILVY